MSLTVCLSLETLYRPEAAGGHYWVYLNWALGLRALGCRIIWLETVDVDTAPAEVVREYVRILKKRLTPYGFADCVALYPSTCQPLPDNLTEGCLDLAAATEADLMLSQRYDMPAEVVRRFRRSGLFDIDPGWLQHWVSTGRMTLAPYDVYFTIGETVGQPNARFSDLGLAWEYVPPCIALDRWPPRRTPAGAPFTT